MIINFYNNNELCTRIEYSRPDEPVNIINYTDDILHRAFGIKETVTWEDLESFLRSRCFPEERKNKKHLLRLLDVSYYNPWEIVRKTQGRMVEDNQWLEIEES